MILRQSQINNGHPQLTQGWKIKKLSDVCEKVSSNVSQNQLTNEDGTYPIYGASGFIKNISFYHCDKDYISIVKDGAGIGRITLLKAYSSVIGTLQYLIPKDELDINFLYYFLSSVDFLKYKNGSTIPHIYFKDYSEEPILIPPLLEQKRIVTILDETFAAIAKTKANTEQNIHLTNKLFESHLKNIFEYKGKGWTKTTLESEVDLLTGFPFKSANYTDFEEDTLLLRGDNILQDKMRWDDVKRWKKSEYNNYGKYQLKENDIVIAMDRPWVKAGLKCARLTGKDIPALLVQRTARLRNKPSVDGSFVYYLIRSKKYVQHLLGVQTGIGVPHISGNQILAYSFFKPSLPVQQTIVHKLDALSTKCKKLESIYQQKIKNLDELKKSILQKAFNGELTTTKAVAV